MKSIFKKHPFLFIFFVCSVLCGGILILCQTSPSFAEFFATGPAKCFRLALAALTSPFPFSLFELSIFCAALFFIYLIFYGIFLLVKKMQKKSVRRTFYKPFAAFGLLLILVFDLFVLTLAPSYYRFSSSANMELNTEKIEEEEVFFALESVLKTVNEAAPFLTLNEAGESVMPKELKEIKKDVVRAADAFGEKNSFFQMRGFAAKNFLSSPLMTYTHISGVYGFFTGEANVNTNYPHFIVTATTAHETCHARGIAPENECNFLAAVILMESDDAYLRYCGAAFVADDLISVCKKLDLERCAALLSETDGVLLKDYAAYSRFFAPYQNSTASKVANTTNNTYLKAMGQKDGTVSYSRIIRLTAAYFDKQR